SVLLGGVGVGGGDCDDEDVGAEVAHLAGVPAQRVGDGGDAEVGDGGPACAEQHGGDVRVQLVDHSGAQELRSDRRAALDEHVPHLAGLELGEYSGQVVGAQVDELAARAAQGCVSMVLAVPDVAAHRQ